MPRSEREENLIESLSFFEIKAEKNFDDTRSLRLTRHLQSFWRRMALIKEIIQLLEFGWFRSVASECPATTAAWRVLITMLTCEAYRSLATHLCALALFDLWLQRDSNWSLWAQSHKIFRYTQPADLQTTRSHNWQSQLVAISSNGRLQGSY